eukprot:scaffold46592_cov80-Skeletonema_marinoi.AAC.1
MLSLHVFESVGEFSFREVLPTDPVNLVANYAHVLRHFLPSGCTRSSNNFRPYPPKCLGKGIHKRRSGCV